jgi:flagellar biogenesis protein FliO
MIKISSMEQNPSWKAESLLVKEFPNFYGTQRFNGLLPCSHETATGPYHSSLIIIIVLLLLLWWSIRMLIVDKIRQLEYSERIKKLLQPKIFS